MLRTQGKYLSSQTVRHYFPNTAFSILHSHINTEISESKRDLSRIQNNCPAGLVFRGSFCRGALNPQAYYLACANTTTNRQSLLPGRCRLDELCSTRFEEVPGANDLSPRAYCVGLGSLFSWVVPSWKSTIENIGASQIGFLRGPGKGYKVEAIMTGLDIHESVNASTIRIDAQKSVMVHGHQVWMTLPAGTSQCSDCGMVELLVPKETQRFSVSVAMAAVAGAMHMVSFES